MLFHVFYHLINAPTRLGRKLLDEIEGFRRYLSVAEEERLRLYAPPETPEKTLELFEEFLPYAVSLSCEQQWGEQFEEVLKAAGVDPSSSSYSPGFYRSDSGFTSGAGMSGFVSDLSGSFTGSLSSSASAPYSGCGCGCGCGCVQLARFADYDPPLSRQQQEEGLGHFDLPLCQRLPPVLEAVAGVASRVPPPDDVA